MRFSTVFAVLTASAMAFAGAVPQAAVKRSVESARDACDGFIIKVQHIIPKFRDCSNDTCSSAIVHHLDDVIDACTAALHTLPDGSQNGNDTSLAHYAAFTVATIAYGLERHETDCGSQCSNLAMLDAKVDCSLSAVLRESFAVFKGFKSLVSSRLVDVLPTLKRLGMNSTLAALSSN